MKQDKATLREHCQLVRERVIGGCEPADAACAELFHIGYSLDSSGDSEAADSVYQQTIELLEDLKAQPGSSLTDSSIARLAFSHGKSLLRFGKPRSAIAAFRRALEVTETSLGWSTNSVLLEQKGMVLGWLALAQRKSELVEESIESYEAAICVWRKLPDLIAAPVNPYTGFLGACLLGLAKSLHLVGAVEQAESLRMEADELLEKEFELLNSCH